MEEKKIIMPPVYPSDRDLAIQLLHMAISLLNRKHNTWELPPVIMPRAAEEEEEV
mgnify:CR=1 FL=1|jgi:hypothetical protein